MPLAPSLNYPLHKFNFWNCDQHSIYQLTEYRTHTINCPHPEGNPYILVHNTGREGGQEGALTEVAAALGGVAVGVVGGGGLELDLPGDDLVAEGAGEVGSVVAGGGGDGDALRVPPRGLAPGPLVLDQDVRRPHPLLLPLLAPCVPRLPAVLVVVVVAIAGAGGGVLRAAALAVGGRGRILAAGPLPGGLAVSGGGGGWSLGPYLGVAGCGRGFGFRFPFLAPASFCSVWVAVLLLL